MNNLFYNLNNSDNNYFCIKNIDYNKFNIYNITSNYPEHKFWFRINNTKIKRSLNNYNINNLNLFDSIILTNSHIDFINFLDKFQKDVLEKTKINLNTMLIIEDFGYKFIKAKTNEFKVFNQNNVEINDFKNYDYYEKNLDIVLELNEIMVNNFNEGWIFWKIIQAKEIKKINCFDINLFEETEQNKNKLDIIRDNIKDINKEYNLINDNVPKSQNIANIQNIHNKPLVPLVPINNMINPMMLLNQLSKLKKVDNEIKENRENKEKDESGNISFNVQLNKVQIKEPKNIKEIYSDIKKSEKEYDKLLILQNFNRLINEHRLFQKKIRKKIKKNHKKYKKIKKQMKKML